MARYVISIRKILSFYLSLYFEGRPLSRSCLGNYARGQIPLGFYIPMERFYKGTTTEEN
jgi:hypothetical protein